jgi:hypothetical protein
MAYELGAQLTLDDTAFTVIKQNRLMGGAVIAADGVYGRVGPKEAILAERDHTAELFRRGFPVPEIIASGEAPDDSWYFTETAVGDKPFHKRFMADYREYGQVRDATFDAYLHLIGKYLVAQTAETNRTTVDASTFIQTVVPHDRVLPNYDYFGKDSTLYQRALDKATQKLADAPMGILQFDLNPYNTLERGVIDFELAGAGPIGYDTLMSPRWSSTWFTSYPSRYQVGYAPSNEQLARNDALVTRITTAAGLSDTAQYMQEFLLIKSAWALSDLLTPQPDWPPDKTAFRKYRANVLEAVVQSYLTDEPIEPKQLAHIPGGELSA